MILWRDSVKFSKDFSDGAILEVIFLESRSISSHLGRRDEQVPKLPKHGPLKRFCEEIRDHFTHGALFRTDFSSPDPIRDKEIANGNVLGTLATRHLTIFLQ
jgi:hypothetical protein